MLMNSPPQGHHKGRNRLKKGKLTGQPSPYQSRAGIMCAVQEDSKCWAEAIPPKLSCLLFSQAAATDFSSFHSPGEGPPFVSRRTIPPTCLASHCRQNLHMHSLKVLWVHLYSARLSIPLTCLLSAESVEEACPWACRKVVKCRGNPMGNHSLQWEVNVYNSLIYFIY